LREEEEDEYGQWGQGTVGRDFLLERRRSREEEEENIQGSGRVWLGIIWCLLELNWNS